MKLDVELKRMGLNGYICSDSLGLVKGKKIKCPLDGSMYEASCIGKLCANCELCSVGMETIGLKLHD